MRRLLSYVMLVAVTFPAMLACSYASDYVYVRRPVALPFSYYAYTAKRPTGTPEPQRPQPAYWDEKTEQTHWQNEKMFLFTGHPELDKSVNLIREGKAAEAYESLTAALATQTDNDKLRAVLYNNLAMVALTRHKLKDAKFNINQAGILNDDDLHILKNARLITSFMQHGLSVIKYEEVAK